MTTEQTPGQCRLCGRSFGRRQMTNHLKSCWKQRISSAPVKSKQSWFHLVIESRYSAEYWLHLQASSKSTFGDLDSVLRRIWLECCDHMSAFEFPIKRPSFRAGTPFDMLAMMRDLAAAADMSTDDEEEVMNHTLSSKLSPGVAFSHEYDFGSTTKLGLRVAGEYAAAVLKGAIKVLARNEPPTISCVACQKPATQICTECACEGEAAFCDICAKQHRCGEEMLLPLINSPRTGVCGYCGPSVEP